MIQIITTEDGSHTLFVPELNEHYHSIHGAIGESDYIYVKSGLRYSKANPVRIFEAGFGTGLNAFLTAIEASIQNRKIFYSSIEKCPLAGTIAEKLNYTDFFPAGYKDIFKSIHEAPWNLPAAITTDFTLNKIKGDLTKLEIAGSFDLVYFDAFGPDKQPEMWTDEVFERISEMTVRDGILVTYSAKGSVRRSLKRAGFDVTLIPGPPGKRQITRAVKI